ncbi:MAG: UxaA family hydrolase [Pirellulales bacterium]|nr:UxaA family hydrolase [Pirellulales bacterium]
MKPAIHCFRVDPRDNVATLLLDAVPGECRVLSEGNVDSVVIRAPIPRGHKVSLADVTVGETVIKYGVVIGRASQLIRRGDHIHLHNCQSQFDERSSTLSVDDGSPTDTPYE